MVRTWPPSWSTSLRAIRTGWRDDERRPGCGTTASVARLGPRAANLALGCGEQPPRANGAGRHAISKTVDVNARSQQSAAQTVHWSRDAHPSPGDRGDLHM